ncbi:diguanylate cyclase [Paenibacillus radicis (ex Xue et al. 2023)]|uniref:Diguanylate cyclase n=1 Tax=Paenibacillus radicis (ex Xue et al. 2023) TaxID=2972489 RepID=A0ABT1YTR8_9BACL|nr:diguanylate cyclase [Paenibacillus radicis (ex Xue et al. 2023)]MCR8636577.1 diguanylate cyclase [Paenibacillus radicis (ex Xue et al. 2023)]
MTYTKLQTKITIMLVIILTVSIGLNNVIGTYLFQKKYFEVLEEQILVIGQSLKSQLDRIHSLGITDRDLVGFDEQSKEILWKYKEISIIYVVNTDGRVLFKSKNQETSSAVLDVPELLDAVKSSREGIVSYTYQDNPYLGAVIPFLDNNETSYEGSVVVVVESNKINHKLSSLYKYPTLLSLLFFVLSFFLIMLALSSWVTNPLKSMVQHMNEAAAGNLRSYANTTARDEIGQLGRVFNRMLKQISGLLMQTAQTVELEGRYNAEFKQRQDGEKLRHALSSVSSTLDEGEVNERILASLRELVPYTSAALWIQHYDTLTAMITRYDESSSGYKDIEYAESQANEMFNLLQQEEQPIVKEMNRVSFLHLPILIESKVRGMIIAQNHSPYIQSEVGLAFTYTSQVGSYIQNAQLYRQMQRLAATDVLTGIHNRRHFFEQAVRIFQQSVDTFSHLGVIMFDVDHFKGVNDQYGHPVGDLVLASVAGRVSTYLLHDESQTFCRYGGEEFVLLINNTSNESVQALAEQIRRGISDLSFPTSHGDLQVTASLGIAYRNEQAETLEKLLKYADNALYKAKASGRNCVAVADEC